MTSRISIFLFAATWISSCAPSSTTERGKSTVIVDDIARTRIDSTLESLVNAGRIAGVSALIWEKNKEVYFNAFGYADREANVAMDRNTIVRIYSMTKPLTGTALMTLHEQGAFELDDPLEKYLPEFAGMKVFQNLGPDGKPVFEPARRPITIRDLTRHTAGFARGDHPYLGPLLAEANPMNPENTLAAMGKKLASVPLMNHPGEAWTYGPSVDVQALLVQQLSGEPFERYLEENVLGPLKMYNTRYVVPEEDLNQFAALYQREGNLLSRTPADRDLYLNTKDWPLKPGGFGLTSTIDDYMRFARMLVNEGSLDDATILKPETVRLMATNQLADSVTERMWLPSKGQVGFGIDFAVRVRPPASPDEKNGVVGEFLWDGAASTLFWVDPVNELTAVLFVQIFPFDNDLHKQFKDAVYGPIVLGK